MFKYPINSKNYVLNNYYSINFVLDMRLKVDSFTHCRIYTISSKIILNNIYLLRKFCKIVTLTRPTDILAYWKIW